MRKQKEISIGHNSEVEVGSLAACTWVEGPLQILWNCYNWSIGALDLASLG